MGRNESPEVTARRAALRRATLHLFVGVALVHGVALLLFRAMGIAQGPERTRTIFVILWTFATALTVAVLLRRVRLARRVTVRPR